MAVCGIDFGTSNSAIAIADDGQVRLAAVEGDSAILPSALFFPPNKPPLYGRAAQQTFFDGAEGRFMRSLKRMLGTELMNWGTLVNDRPRRFDELIGGFVSHLKKAGETAAGTPLTAAVFGRPVHFVDRDPGADEAAEMQLQRIAAHAGFRDVAFQFEPIAAAFAHERRLSSEKLALVADIGGGTSDFTVIRLGPAHMGKTDRAGDILGNSGIRTGGNDFDKSLSLGAFMPAFGYGGTHGAQRLPMPRAPFHDLSEWSKVNFVYAPKIARELLAAAATAANPQHGLRLETLVEHEYGHRLLGGVEQTKITLSSAEAARADLGFIESGFALDVTAPQFAATAAPHIDDITQSLRDCLQQAGVGASDIALCILTGGPTEMPVLRQAILAQLPDAAVSEDDKLSSVALGLGWDARRRFG